MNKIITTSPPPVKAMDPRPKGSCSPFPLIGLLIVAVAVWAVVAQHI